MAKVLITGGAGYIGRHLTKVLLEKGYHVAVLSRQRNTKNNAEIPTFYWDVNKNEIDPEALSSCDYIIHLAGANIGEKRWTNKRKQQISDSRIRTAELILQNVNRHDHHLRAFISSSAVGYYGAISSAKLFKETDLPGEDFLGEVCKKWELTADHFSQIGARVVKIRTGIVLSEKGGAFARLSLPARYGLGFAIGNGRQYLPWIHIEDLCNIYLRAIENTELEGPYNAVAPEHITNKEFARKIAQHFKKTFWLPNIPGIFIKLVLGEMAAMLLKGSRVSSRKIESTGFKFKFPGLDSALDDL